MESFKERIEREEKINLSLTDLKAFMYGKMDWIKVFKDAYASRKTSWWEIGYIQEWRNATDEVLFAVWKQIEDNFKSSLKGNER